MKPAYAATILVLFLISCEQRTLTREETFWRWFEANEARLFEFEKDREKIFNELGTQLHRFNPGLTFEFGPKDDEGKREFVISADGIKDVFPAVIALAQAAPKMGRWKVTKFRPRRLCGNTINFQGVTVTKDQVQFSMEAQDKKVGIVLYISGHQPNKKETYSGIGFLLLDDCLGEYDVETKVGSVDVLPSTAQVNEKKSPLSELTTSFDQLFEKTLKGH